jgi:hypothetical protein
MMREGKEGSSPLPSTIWIPHGAQAIGPHRELLLHSLFSSVRPLKPALPAASTPLRGTRDLTALFCTSLS